MNNTDTIFECLRARFSLSHSFICQSINFGWVCTCHLSCQHVHSSVSHFVFLLYIFCKLITCPQNFACPPACLICLSPGAGEISAVGEDHICDVV